jgi:hypothetical protein
MATTTMDLIEEAARRAAASFNCKASNFAATQKERDVLCRHLATSMAELNERNAAKRKCLLSKLEGVRSALRRREGETDAAGVAALAERASHLETRAELVRADKRANRKDRESNGLHSKISLKSKMGFFLLLSL